MRPPSLIALVVAAALLASVVRLVRDLPAQAEYHEGADEGTYLRQGLAVRDGGLAAFRQLARDYAASPDLQHFPPPSRIGSITAAAVAVRIEPSFHALSTLSMVSFVALGLATFVWGRRVWGEPAAALAAVLLMVSPLDAGMARRALMDGHLALFLGVALLAFVSWLQAGRSRDFIWFAAAAVWAMLVKETAFFFVPFFFAAAAILKWRGDRAISTRHLAVIASLPLVAIVLALIVLGGVDLALGVARALRAEALTSSYSAAYGAGPWHEYLVDHVLLSPVSLLFFAWCGTWMVSREFPRAATLVIGFFWWGIAALSLFPKNPRYAMPIDLPLRLGAALLIVELIARLPAAGSRRWLWRAAAAAALVVIVIVDLATYHRMFIASRVYDPVAANLVVVEKMAPPQVPASPAISTPESLLEQSARAYQSKDFAGSIRFAEAALALRPDYAEAYNNIGSSYCELKEWNKAIAALQRALALNPNYPLARNNLAWAQASLK